jgi:hypothetical protein
LSAGLTLLAGYKFSKSIDDGSGVRTIGTDVVHLDAQEFQLYRAPYLQFRFEAFNAANHSNWGDPGVSLNVNRLDSSGIPIPGDGGVRPDHQHAHETERDPRRRAISALQPKR